MSRQMVVSLSVVLVLLLILSVTVALAQPAGQSGSGGGPGSPILSGPGGGPPGMALPKDVAKGSAPVAPNPAKASKTIWIVAGVVLVLAVAAWAFTRKKQS